MMSDSGGGQGRDRKASGESARGKGRGGRPQGGKKQGAGRQGQGSRRGEGRRREPDVDEKVARLAGPLQKVLARLPETQRRVLELRMGLVDGHPRKLGEVSQELGLSLHETREIEQRAFAHIREAVPLDQLSKFLDR